MSTSEIIDIHGPLKGEIEVPGDKSMTHRAIMLAASSHWANNNI